jgi:hypothetical protein
MYWCEGSSSRYKWEWGNGFDSANAAAAGANGNGGPYETPLAPFIPLPLNTTMETCPFPFVPVAAPFAPLNSFPTLVQMGMEEMDLMVRTELLQVQMGMGEMDLMV